MTKPRDINDILARLSDAKQSGDNWIAPCPLPGHKTPAKHLTLKDGGNKTLVTCQGGRHDFRDKRDYKALCQWLGFDSLSHLPNGIGNEAKIAAIYDYTDTNDKLLYQVVRFDPKNFRQRQPDGNGYWLWNLKNVTPVLYHLPEVIEAILEERTIME